MKPLAFPLHTDERIVSTLDDILAAFSARYGPGTFRKKLRDGVDRLYEVCTVMEESGEAETEEDAYFRVFDALAHLTNAIRWPGVNVQELRHAQGALVSLRELAILY